MTTIFSAYGGINAKINAMQSRLLSDDDYANLAALNSVSEVGSRLRDFGEYGTLISTDTELHRGYIERKVVLSIYEEFTRIYSFITDAGLRGYLNAFFLKNQINFIKIILRSINDERDISYTLPEVNSFVGRRLGFDFAALFKAKTLNEAIEALRGTVIYSHLSLGANSRDETYSLFDLEMRLDIFYYLHLNKLQNKYLSGINKEIARKINGMEIDMTNISWIYRLKRYYNIQDVSMYAYIIPINYRLSRTQVARMAEAKTVSVLTAEIDKTPYGRFFKDSELFEHNFYVMKNAALSKMRILYPDSIANVLSYIYFKELEIRNIVSLIEGIRYGLGKGDIRRYIVAPSEKEVV